MQILHFFFCRSATFTLLPSLFKNLSNTFCASIFLFDFGKNIARFFSSLSSVHIWVYWQFYSHSGLSTFCPMFVSMPKYVCLFLLIGSYEQQVLLSHIFFISNYSSTIQKKRKLHFILCVICHVYLVFNHSAFTKFIYQKITQSMLLILFWKVS